jgi:2-amino-4-hydroxy-6-hydroxymethyldihydropteridine diphosphokinase
MKTAFIGLGSNVGDRIANLSAAIRFLTEAGIRVVDVSPVYETDPVGYTLQPSFFNAAARIATALGPVELVALLKRIEARMGREPTFPNGPRLIDLDLLLYEQQIVDEEGARVPHPRMAERAFVLVPLADITPDAWHPLLHKTVGQLAADLGSSGVRRLSVGPLQTLPETGSG